MAKKPLLPPRSPARYRFVLTPLADAMFQLLIFFMLSSNLAPYSLLTIRSGTTGDPAGASSVLEALSAADVNNIQIAGGPS